jgi:hypothetical protein
VTLNVTDGWSVVSQAITWTILAPTVQLSTASGSVSGPFDVSVAFNMSVTGLVSGDFTVQNGSVTSLTGAGAAYTARITPAAGGTVNVSLPANAAQDVGGVGNAPSNVLSVTYTPPNRPPTLTNPGNLSSERGASVFLQVQASDPDNQSLTFSAIGLPAGLAIHPVTGVISGVVTAPAGTVAAVTLTVSDGSLQAQAAFTWTITGPSFTGWLLMQGLAGQNGSGNSDGDVYSNLQEFAHGLPPSSGANGAVPVELRHGATIDAAVRRITGIQNLSYALEYIADLAQSGPNGAGWSVAAIAPSLTYNPDGSEVAVYANLAALPGLGAGRGFVRVRVSSDINGDGDAADSGEVARSGACGWLDHSFAAGTQSFSLPFALAPVFTGMVDWNNAGAISVAPSTGAASIASLLTPGKSYQAEVLSGPLTGHRWKVAPGSDATVIAVNPSGTVVLAGGELPGARIALREMPTLGNLFPAAQFHAGASPGTSDRILVYNPSAPGPWTTYFLADLSSGGLGIHWLRAGSGVTSYDALPIDPCQGVLVQRQDAAPAVVLSGFVRDSAVACPLLAGYNLVAAPFPLASSPQDRLMTWDGAGFNGFTGGLSPVSSDKSLLWNGDATPGAEGYATYWLLNAGADPWRRWIRSGDPAAASVDAVRIFPPARAHFIQSAAGNPAWVLPPNWIP